MTSVHPHDHAAHDLDLLSEALDGRLSEQGEADVVARMRVCSACRSAYETMSWARTQARRAPVQAIPEGLEAGLRAQLRDATSGTTGAPRRWRRALIGFAAAAALVLGLASLLTRTPVSPPSLPEAVASDYRLVTSGRLDLALETDDAGRLEAWFAEARLGFPVRVFDLKMMGYTLRGGAIRALASGQGALSVYREVATGRDVLCEMLRVSPSALPPPAERREHDGISFKVYRMDGVTLVFWPEGEVLCVLAGSGDPEALVQLAFAKAMKARRTASLVGDRGEPGALGIAPAATGRSF